MAFLSGLAAAIVIECAFGVAAYLYFFLKGTRVPTPAPLPPEPWPVRSAVKLDQPKFRQAPLLRLVPDEYSELGGQRIETRHAPPTIVRTAKARCPCGWESKIWNGGAAVGMAELDYVRHKARYEDLDEEEV